MPGTVADQSPAVAKMAKPWAMIKALVGGTQEMREAGKTLLPKFPKETEDAYQIRLQQAVLFAAFSNTCEVLASKPMSRQITYQGVPKSVENLFSNVDGEDSTLHAFTSQLLRQALQFGIGGILVDAPPGEGVRTKADEVARGIRPYFAAYSAQSILGWRADKNGELTLLRLMETVTEEDGDFGDTEVDQVRVLKPGSWEIYRKKQVDGFAETRWVLHNSGTTTLPVIPFVFFYGIKVAFGVGQSPLLDLAFANVEHWQSSSDQQNLLHVARVPILFGKGFDPTDEITVGANTMVKTSAESADLKFVEHTGAAIEAGRDSLKDNEDRMRQLGAELLIQQTLNVTATQTLSEGEASKSKLQLIVESFEETLAKAIDFLGLWMGESVSCTVEIFKDFGAASLSDDSADTLMKAQEKGAVSMQTVHEGLRRRDIIPAGKTWDEEQAQIKAERAAGIGVPPEPKPTPGAPSPAPSPTPPDPGADE